MGRTAFGASGSYKSVTSYQNTDDTSLPGPGIIVDGASGGNGAKYSSTKGGSQPGDNPTTTGAINGGGGGLAQGASGFAPYHGSGSAAAARRARRL